ncbi:MAG: PAS domain-containing sensor histidine kinase [Chitinophagaceae bacterium]
MKKKIERATENAVVITEQRNIQQWEAVFNYATIGIVLTDGKGCISNFNKYAEMQFGYTREEVLNMPVEILIPATVHTKHETYRKAFNQDPQNRVMGAGRDLYARKKNGIEFPVEISLSHYAIENEEFVIAFVVDITLRKNNEDLVLRQRNELVEITSELKNLNQELEQKILERTMMLKETLVALEKSKEELNQALEVERELGDLKSRFVTLASHGFGTPLSEILTSLFLIGKYTTAEDQDKREKHILQSKDAITQMRNVLDDFLSLGKLEEGKIEAHFSEFDLKEFLTNIIDKIRIQSKPGQQFIHSHNGDFNVLLDQLLLKNIIKNLISNTVKFSPENSAIIITSYVDNDKIQISIKDEGIGISEEDLQHLYERFFRAKNAQDTQGTGLGLHIVAKYLKLMGGIITCTSELEKGTEFMIAFKKKP